jgi:hypothetical protein
VKAGFVPDFGIHESAKSDLISCFKGGEDGDQARDEVGEASEESEESLSQEHERSEGQERQGRRGDY